jgi:sigma-B regulation protein RsbU (phosphoserine phosphatase)
VGGDYYDVRSIGPDSWCAVVADVSGKGVSSALVASFLQGAFLMASEGQSETEEMMHRISQFLSERTEGEKYATIFYCALNRSGLLRWANAGHCSPVVLRRDGAMEALQPTGMPAGLLSTAKYTVETTRLNPGDKVAVYTDGLSEAQDAAGRFFENRRIMDLLEHNARLGCQDLLDQLMRAVEAFTSGAEQSDDITAVVLEYAP